MESGIIKTENLHYETPLPFKSRPLLPNNRVMALTRLEHLKRIFIKDGKYKEDYIKFINEILSRGDAEEAPSVPPENQETWYIPHHSVYHPKKQKIRVVFDCSARFKGSSLNDQLLSEPDLTNNLLGVLCRFRMYSPVMWKKCSTNLLCLKTIKTICASFGGPMETPSYHPKSIG